MKNRLVLEAVALLLSSRKPIDLYLRRAAGKGADSYELLTFQPTHGKANFVKIRQVHRGVTVADMEQLLESAEKELENNIRERMDAKR